MQLNDTRSVLKSNKSHVISFPIVIITTLAIANITNSLFAIARAANPKLKQSNNKEPRLNPICWQCGSERALLKVHTAQGVHFVCHTCGGEQ